MKPYNLTTYRVFLHLVVVEHQRYYCRYCPCVVIEAAMDASLTALSNLLDTITRISKEASIELGKGTHQITAVHLRAYYGKVYFLAKYICDEEKYSIQAVEEGNAEDFQDFIGEVVDKAESCKKDLEVLIEYLETERQTTPLQQHREERKYVQPKSGTYTAVFGAAMCTGCGIIVWIRSSNNNDVTKDALVSFNDRETVKTLAMLGLVIGLVLTTAGILVAIKDHSKKLNNADNEQEHYWKNIGQMKLFFSKIKNELQTANNHLKSTIGVAHPHQQQSQRSLVLDVKDVTETARGLRDYCQDFKDASSLEHFISCHNKN